ncbi:hypothetical protein [Emticicia sp. BO119]|uniref:rolling circle replication-associated protein n=1 Tax=Emticicia sp. BO119 TaxID=2757768 RepID=UPI0015F0A8D3|nr:hypothetical protein [Emticicia sp. BO119]MBA4849471.1 hypothetical protein [Emticicia sp. BO119]
MSQFDIFGNVATPKKALATALKNSMLKQVSKSHDDDNDTTRVLATIKTTATIKPHVIVVSSKFGKASYPGSPEEAAKYIQSQNSLKNLLQETDKLYNGYLSPNTKRMIKKRLDNWLTSISENVKFKYLKKEVNRNQVYPTFITLTLPDKQKHKDQTIKDRCFMPFIEWLTSASQEVDRKGNPKGCGVQCYFWRAETQKNGNVHFHLIVDRYIPYDRLRKKWNQYIERLGYVTRYRQKMQFIYENGFVVNTKQQMFEVQRLRKIADRFNKTKKMPKISMQRYSRLLDEMKEATRLNRKVSEDTLYAVAEEMQRDAYFMGQDNNWSNPNTTDIKKVDNIASLASYVCKYIAKDVETAPLLANQTFEESNGKKYVVTATQEDGITFIVSKEEYKPVFLVRKVRGRIWGCSDNLRSKEVEYPKYELVEEERVLDSDPKAVKKFYNRTLGRNYIATECVDAVKSDKKHVREFRVNDFCVTYSSKQGIKPLLTKPIQQDYTIHYQNLFRNLYGTST